MSIGLEYEPNEVRSRFELPNAKPMYPRDINFRIINMKLQIAVHITERSIKGKVEYNLEKLDLVSLDEIVLDAKELDIEEVTCQGRQAKFEHVGGKLHISPGKIEGKKIDVGLKYSGRPEAGIYFVTPDDDHDGRIASFRTKRFYLRHILNEQWAKPNVSSSAIGCETILSEFAISWLSMD